MKWWMLELESRLKKYESKRADSVASGSLLSLIRINVLPAVYLMPYLLLKRESGRHKPSRVISTFRLIQIHSFLTITHSKEQHKEDVWQVYRLVTKVLLALTQFA